MDIFPFHPCLEVFVAKFFAVIRLNDSEVVDLDFVSKSSQRLLLLFSRFSFDGFHPSVLGKHVDHCQQIPVSTIGFGNVDHFDQIRHP